MSYFPGQTLMECILWFNQILCGNVSWLIWLLASCCVCCPVEVPFWGCLLTWIVRYFWFSAMFSHTRSDSHRGWAKGSVSIASPVIFAQAGGSAYVIQVIRVHVRP
jgi:hypothetical protein